MVALWVSKIGSEVMFMAVKTADLPGIWRRHDCNRTPLRVKRSAGAINTSPSKTSSPYRTPRACIKSTTVLPCLVEMREKRCSETSGVRKLLLLACAAHSFRSYRGKRSARTIGRTAPQDTVPNVFTRETMHLESPRSATIKPTRNIRQKRMQMRNNTTT